jgi:His-Xaa-Ser system protein HxsD
MQQEVVTFDVDVYSVAAVKKAAYRYLHAFSAEISTEGSNIKCGMSFLSELSAESIASIIADFKKEVLDQDLRESLKRETEQVRNLILAHAFSRTGISTK